MQERQPVWMYLILALLVSLGIVGCATMGEQSQSLVPTQYRTRTGPYAVFSNFPIAADSSAIRSLHSLENDVEANLGVRVNADEPPVEVYILNDRQSFSHFLKFYYPELPPRRAFFLAQGTQRVVFTFMGERLEEDLRHEATHALLNVAYGDLPLWLDEGLAEYFEGADSQRGLNKEHLGRLPKDMAAGWKPDMARLETLTSVRQMTPRDYRESWAWVHYLLNGPNTGKTVLLSYLADLRSDPKAAKLSVRLRDEDGNGARVLLAYLERIRDLPVAVQPTSDATTVRLQDNTLEPTRTAAPQRRSVFTRMRAFFGF
ncbi:Protein of unknown function [Singulisphaera sp. GP187]|uniref:DUF1570 domain-containing protein n=1 Tax=Singulisphaera sp. GP187 TaxID=1882752 RepID=UPI0009258B99|nr:DUF1570 domain-containing protein [Singulisphaera sp. GP187]SIO59999.1 Protein of unknown function [Singulisphaera sp. GP187]